MALDLTSLKKALELLQNALRVAGPEALDRDTVRLLKEDFENSILPFRVDVLDWHQFDASFREIIEKESEVLQ